MPTLSTAVRNTLADALDAAWNGGTLELRSGARPASANDANAGTLLGAVALPADLYAAAAAGSKALTGQVAVTVTAAGTIGHVRLRQSGDTGAAAATGTQHRADLSASATGGGGEVVFDNPAVAVGQVVTITSLPLTVPAS